MPRRYQVVIVPVDFSERSALALEAARELIEDEGVIHVVHALIPLPTVGRGVFWGTIDDHTRRARVTEALTALCEKAGASGAHLAVVGSTGSPASGLVAYAAEVSGDVIVLSSHGRTGLAHFAMGSVAERVVRHAHCDVLVVRARREDS